MLKCDHTIKIFMVTTNENFEDFFGIFIFGHFFCPFLKNEKKSWKKICYVFIQNIILFNLIHFIYLLLPLLLCFLLFYPLFHIRFHPCLPWLQ